MSAGTIISQKIYFLVVLVILGNGRLVYPVGKSLILNMTMTITKRISFAVWESLEFPFASEAKDRKFKSCNGDL